jgi:hypothetical protein
MPLKEEKSLDFELSSIRVAGFFLFTEPSLESIEGCF